MKLILTVLFFILATSNKSDARTVEIKNKKENQSYKEYKLNTGNKIKVTIFEEDSLSGDYEIDSQGNINMPLIGVVVAKNTTISQLENTIKNKYKNGYLVNPIVNLDLLSVQPFFVIGEINNPGSYQYESNMTVLNAIATAGGYTYRANKRKIYIERTIENEKTKIRTKEDSKILPGDVLIIKERFF